MRHSVNAITLCSGILLSAPVYAATDEVLLDEITIRIIENEKTPLDVNDIALPPVRAKSNDKRQDPSENADERMRLRLESSYELDRTWTTQAELTYTDNDSTEADSGYHKYQARISINGLF